MNAVPTQFRTVALYPQILGEAAWNELAGSIRSAHRVGDEKHGRFRVTHGRSRLARQSIRWSKLPRATDDAHVVLKIHAEEDRERWERHFDGDSFTTLQSASGGRLVERFDCWELHFALSVLDRALVYEQCGARLCLGPMRLPVPLIFAPRVRASEKGDGPARVTIHVTVTLPLVGLLIAYEGYLDVEEELAS